jgi:hypothetical protein
VGESCASCPLCRQNPLPFIVAPKVVTNMLCRIDVRCAICSLVVKRDSFQSHVNEVCPVPCPNVCGESQTRVGLAKHVEVCVNEYVPCEAAGVGCDVLMRRRDIGEHHSECQFVKDKVQLLLVRIQELENEVDELGSEVKGLEKDVTFFREISAALENAVVLAKAESSGHSECQFVKDRVLLARIRELENEVDELGSQVKQLKGLEKEVTFLRENSVMINSANGQLLMRLIEREREFPKCDEMRQFVPIRFVHGSVSKYLSESDGAANDDVQYAYDDEFLPYLEK